MSPDYAELLTPWRRRHDGAYRARLRLMVEPELLDPDLELFIWSAAHWQHVGIYGGNTVRIGAGYRLFTMPKAEYVRRFGLCCADGWLELLTDGCAWVVMKRSEDNRPVNGLAPDL